MRSLFKAAVAATVLAGIAGAASAQPVTSKDAKKMLFRGKNYIVQVVENAPIPADQMAQIEALAKAMGNPQVAAQFVAAAGYYGAIAVQPGTAISEKTMAISAGLHSPQAAQAVALQGCNDLDGPDCVVVATVLPKRYKAQPLSLSQPATAAVFSDWNNDGPIYMAASPSSTAWVVARGTGADQAALERCNESAVENGGVADCEVVVADE